MYVHFFLPLMQVLSPVEYTNWVTDNDSGGLFCSFLTLYLPNTFFFFPFL